jgi:hypothetical protein
MALTRIVYTHSGVTVDTHAVATAQNATVTFNIPRENVNVFGLKGTVDRPQLDAADATFEFSMIPQDSGSQTVVITPLVIQGWINESLANQPARILVAEAAGIGTVENCLLNSLSTEATVGAMASMTLSYTGAPSINIPIAAVAGVAGNIPLVSPKDISLAGGGGELDAECAQSAALSWDLPVETVTCLGGDPEDSDDVYAFGNPPGTSSLTIEGLKEGLLYNKVAQDYTLSVGDYGWKLKNGRIDSQTNSLAVGDVFGTFNYVIAGTADGFEVQ